VPFDAIGDIGASKMKHAANSKGATKNRWRLWLVLRQPDKIRPYKGFRGLCRGEPRVHPTFSDSLLGNTLSGTKTPKTLSYGGIGKPYLRQGEAYFIIGNPFPEQGIPAIK
jgi:hypothetical protein